MSAYRRRRSVVAGALIAAAVCLSATSSAGAASGPTVQVGVGRADITPLTGGFKGGWACSCAKAVGQHTRLYARAVVIKHGDQKIALVAEDLALLGGGMIRDAAAMLVDRGFSEQNIISSATHTHGSQGGYMNFSADNSVLPRSPNLTEFNLTDTAANPALYNFMTKQLAAAIMRADNDLAPGATGWGHTELLGVTQNRSLEAHLANYGISEELGAGTVAQDPGGYAGTIDPSVDVLRVDQYRRGRRVPVGMFSAFANHGTVVKPTFPYFTADHHGSAERVVEATIRREAHVPAGQDIVNAFAGSDAGDVSAGIINSGPADADVVGRQEAAAMLRAWRAAGRSMTRTAPLSLRWTRVCFCGQNGTDTNAVIGLAAGAGSEELRTVFYDAGVAREGARLPTSLGPQGFKIPLLPETGNVPKAVPMAILRLGNRLIITVPGEATVGVGKMIREAIMKVAGPAGVARVVIVGYAGEYLNYFATPAEYDRQFYEGGFTMYGRNASLILRDTAADLAQRLVSGQPAAPPFPYDPNNGTHVTAAGFGSGAASGVATAQPQAVAPLGHAAMSWRGGGNGIDRPVDAAFVTVQRRDGGRWRPVASDLGVQIVWSSDAKGNYRAQWEVPVRARRGSYRLVVTAKRYELTSEPFNVTPGAILTPTVDGDAVVLRYPPAIQDKDWTARPPSVSRGRIVFQVGNRRRIVTARSGGRFPIPAGGDVRIPPGGATDSAGNVNPAAVRVR